MHETGDNEFRNMATDMKSFKYISYEIVRGKESKQIQLVTSQVHAFIYKFMFEQLHFIPYLQKNLILRSFCVNRYKLVSSSEFIEKTHQYIQHVRLARWQDEKFRICRDTFPCGTILSVVDFFENYTL